MARQAHRGLGPKAVGSLAPSFAWPSLDRGSRRRLGGAALISVLAHATLSPIPLLLGLAAWFLEKPVDEPAVDEIPIEFLGIETLEPEAPPPKPVDVGPPVDAISSTAPQAPATPSGPKPNESKREPKVVAAPPAKPASGLVDPVALAGDAGKLADSNANVRVLLYTDQIRENAFGPEIGRLLQRAPQWSDFFGAARVDPIMDLDRILVAGPSLRNTSNVVAVVEHHLPANVIEGAFDALVARGGEFLAREPQMLARAEADRAERLFAAPNAHIVVVAPPSAAASLKKLKKGLKFPKGPSGVAAQLYVKELTKLLKLFGIKAPETLSSARAEVRPTEDGGARIDITLDDSNKEQRAEHADELEALVRRATKVDFRKMGALGALAALAFGGQEKTFVEEVEFGVKGEHIVGALTLTRAQIRTLLDFADAALPPLPAARPAPTTTPLSDPADPAAPPAARDPSAIPKGAPEAETAPQDPQAPSEESSPPSPDPASEGSPVAPPDEPGREPAPPIETAPAPSPIAPPSEHRAPGSQQ